MAWCWNIEKGCNSKRTMGYKVVNHGGGKELFFVNRKPHTQTIGKGKILVFCMQLTICYMH